MSSLRSTDKRYLEDLFGMSSGYVLDFTDTTFAEFFRDLGDFDIHSDRYTAFGTSKANKLRKFWQLEDDSVVGDIIHALLDHWAIITPDPTSKQAKLAARCRVIANRLKPISQQTVDEKAEKRIWGSAGYRVFLSHKWSVKRETAHLKKELAQFGMSAFVAHKDIEVSQEWQREIENALKSMDAFVALFTEDFHDSDWTDQEIGFALAREVPVVAARLGKNPYGFIGKFQGAPEGWDDLPFEIAKVFLRKDKDKAFTSYVNRLSKSESFIDTIKLGSVLQHVEELNTAQVDMLVEAHNSNDQLWKCAVFTRAYKSNECGPGLYELLKKWDSRKFRVVDIDGKRQLVTESKED